MLIMTQSMVYHQPAELHCLHPGDTAVLHLSRQTEVKFKQSLSQVRHIIHKKLETHGYKISTAATAALVL